MASGLLWFVKKNINSRICSSKMGSSPPRILVIPYPAQGHVIPLMEFSICLAKYGLKITFVTTENNHGQLLKNVTALKGEIHLASISDGLESSDGTKRPGGIPLEAVFRVLPGKVEKLIEEINASESDKISCILADRSVRWALEIAERKGIRRAAFCPAAAAHIPIELSIPKLIEDGIIDEDGTPTKEQMIKLSPTMPAMNTAEFTWTRVGDKNTQRSLFGLTRSNESLKLMEWQLCNSSYELEPGVFTSTPNIHPVGPLLAKNNRHGDSAGSFWPEDKTCLEWLEQQPPQSVIYAAFGSITLLGPTQFQELALGLELTTRPFILVVRPDSSSRSSDDAFFKDFQDRVGTRGKIVSWAPQQKVLAHPSIACFVTHCGWNSTMEGVGNGIPFLCWPCFGDQFFNQSYVCDVWKTGLRFNKDENGMIARWEVKDKVEQLLSSEEFKSRAGVLQGRVMDCVKEGGSSHQNLMKFRKVANINSRICSGKNSSKMGSPHILVIPYPAQGHVSPLMEFSICLAKYGVKITFAITENNHEQLVKNVTAVKGGIHLVSISDELESSDGTKRPGLVPLEVVSRVLPGKVEKLIEQINSSDSDKISCILADRSVRWALEIAERMGIRRAVFCPAAAAGVLIGLSIPKLIEDGIIDEDGTPTKVQMIKLSPTMPAMNTDNFSWTRGANKSRQKTLFELVRSIASSSKLVDWRLCNSSYELETGVFTSAPHILPIGPLLAKNRLGDPAGSFWPEDTTCLQWLEQQPPQSVIYAAFGSTTIFNPTQFQELALGLELTTRPFLLVVVSPESSSSTWSSNDAFFKNFEDRVGSRGKIVSWAPQQKVLAHTSVACFVTHCGWNSTMEGVGNGIPFLCLPYHTDQFLNQSYICDVWKTGLGLTKDENGMITRWEIKDKVEQLLSSGEFRSRARDLQERVMDCVKEGGSSHQNVVKFVEWIKGSFMVVNGPYYVFYVKERITLGLPQRLKV
ncbi:hypothetical protein Tsubulata_015172 [Turnera subulata]|uniref:UDP-glycosyltransferases domain-containing protein n=1 Tax=Turnera subulata TaxID=218843 RepID=A0A9Q0F7C3_9ROSI|nr:hypothetical protein Tsubulata_015172 [Turnera subulata]